MADIDPDLIAALMARAPTSNIGLANEGHGPDTGATARPYDPTWRDKLARLLMGDRPDEARMGVADSVLGTRGFGPSSPLPMGMSAADLTPVGPGLDFLDKSASGDIGGAMASGAGAAMMAPGIGGRMLSEVGGAMGSVADAGRSGISRMAEMLSARPATSAAAGATGAVLGSTPEAGEARVDHPDRPKPPASPAALPGFADFLASRHAAEAARLGEGYGAKSRARTEQEAKKAYADLEAKYGQQVDAHKKAMDAWGTSVANFDKAQAERDRQAEFKQSFNERHPIANAALVGAGYVAPFAIGRRAANATNAERAGLLESFNTARDARTPTAMADSVLAARRLENTPSTGLDNLKTAFTVAAPAEAQSLGRVIDMATTGSDTEAYKKAEGDLTSPDYYKKLIPQLMSGGVLYSLGGKLPLPGMGPTSYDKGAYKSMMDDFIPRATEPALGGLTTRNVAPTPESTTAHIARLLAAGDRHNATTGANAAFQRRRVESAERGDNPARWRERDVDGRFVSGE